MKRLLMIIVALCSLLHAEQEPVSIALSGTVHDDAGNPLAGVTVTLAVMDNLSTVTGADGAFILTDASGVLQPENLKASYGFTFRNNAIIFTTVSEKISGTMSLYSGDGRLITSVSLGNLHTGQQRVALPELSSGIYLLAGTVGGKSFTRSLVCMGNYLHLRNETRETDGNGSFTLRKRTAAAVADTLIASKDGYGTVKLPLNSYSMSDIAIVLAEAGGFTISSTSFSNGDPMPAAYTCEGKPFGEGVAPQLQWNSGPEGTISYAIVFKDTSLLEAAPQFAFHWMIWNIPSTVAQLPEGLPGDQFSEVMGGAEQFSAGPGGGYAYLGPCPSWETFCSDGEVEPVTDTYTFTLYAFNSATLTLPEADTSVHPNYVGQMDAWFETMAISKTEITTTSNATPNEFAGCPPEEGGFSITSTAFSEGDEMPDEYTCEGKAMSGSIAPPLAWSGVPEGTKSLALFFKDLTLAEQGSSLGFHWGVWNIPTTVTGMPEGLGGDQFPSEMGGAEQLGALKAMGSNSFFGPCPSSGNSRTTDTYAAILYAFDEEEISPPTNLQQMDAWFEENAIASTSISVTSDAKTN